ncbi:aldehyde dehydrogenase family protein [Paraburkholderia sediminicola]|uniref:aldehyde dehydrogenase family protein n=1 Tax=Paraburkholderia sediminicola TaxID=458836 RepID=UPI0038B93123
MSKGQALLFSSPQEGDEIAASAVWRAFALSLSREVSMSSSAMRLGERNPATGEIFARYPFYDSEEIERTLTRSMSGFSQWRRVPVADRAQVLIQLAGVLRNRVGEMSAMMSLEMGKPIAQARAEIEKCVNLLSQKNEFYHKNYGCHQSDSCYASLELAAFWFSERV